VSRGREPHDRRGGGDEVARYEHPQTDRNTPQDHAEHDERRSDHENQDLPDGMREVASPETDE
jgi:hypothetical protein